MLNIILSAALFSHFILLICEQVYSIRVVNSVDPD